MKNLPMQRRDDDKGFTLIELMVVVLIIAILLAIAIPTFLGAQNKAKDRSAQSSARNALTNAKVLYADGGVYATSTPETAIANSAAAVTALIASEPALAFVVADSTKPKEVSVLVPIGGKQFYAAVKSDTNVCFYISDNVGAAIGGVPQGTNYFKATAPATCVANATGPYTATGW
jgi:type IV pilus assembly protein PilA